MKLSTMVDNIDYLIHGMYVIITINSKIDCKILPERFLDKIKSKVVAI